jgi:ubiquinone/menaquinone biosynthesis C-methylase UbiE
MEGYWSRFAHTYDRDGEYVVGRPVIEAIVERLRRERRLGKVLELGCGTGFFTKVIAGNSDLVIATDLSEEMLEVAKRQLGGLGNVRVRTADCERTAYPTEKFDSLFLANVLHVIDNPARCLKESYRVLRGGGLLLVVDFTVHGMQWFEKVKMGIRYLQRWGIPPRGGRSDLSCEELACLVEAAGFVVDKLELIEVGSNALYLKGRKPR